MNAIELMITIWLFFFTDRVLELIVRATNSKAAERVVRVTENGKSILRPPKGSDPSTLPRRPRWPMLVEVPVTIAEMIVILGMRITMGAFRKKRDSHFWNESINGMALPLIKDTMVSKRYETIMSALSFMEVGDPSFPGDPLRKMRAVNDALLARAKLAWDLEAWVAIDEARVKLCSKYCPFTWTMMCKPIKDGCTVRGCTRVGVLWACVCVCVRAPLGYALCAPLLRPHPHHPAHSAPLRTSPPPCICTPQVYCAVFDSGYCYSWRWWLGKHEKNKGPAHRQEGRERG